MKLPLPLLLGLVLLVVLASPARAQHDPHRNSVRHIAANKWQALEKELGKADQDDPETRFVRALAAAHRGNLEEAEQQAAAALQAGLPIERLLAGPRALDPLRQRPVFADWEKQHAPSGPSPLLHGPMLGAVTDRTANVWLRTAEPATVRVVVRNAQGNIATASEARTTADSDRTAVLKLDNLRPATNYRYEISVNGKAFPHEGRRLRTAPTSGKPAQFRVAMGGGAGFVPQWERMWDTILAQQPDAMLMLGDNVYIDDPKTRMTSDYCYYRRQSRPEWRRLIARTPIYAIYDDHDFGANDCVPGPEIESPAWKRQVWNQFRTQWANPSYGGGPTQPGCWFDFMIGDVHFILLDGRYYRRRGEEPSMLGPVQLQWLKQTLKQSKGTFKVLTSPVPWTAGIKPGSKDPWDGFPAEREAIFSFIEENRIDGVVLAAADRHRSDLRINQRPNGYPLYEFESSKLTNRHTHPVVKTPGLVWGYNQKCSFGLMHFDTTKTDPTIRFEVHSIDGERIHTHELKRSELTFDAAAR